MRDTRTEPPRGFDRRIAGQTELGKRPGVGLRERSIPEPAVEDGVTRTVALQARERRYVECAEVALPLALAEDGDVMGARMATRVAERAAIACTTAPAVGDPVVARVRPDRATDPATTLPGHATRNRRDRVDA